MFWLSKEVTWYHEGSEWMRTCRYWIADYSLKRARERIAQQKANLQISDIERSSKMQESYRNMRVRAHFNFAFAQSKHYI